MGVHKMLIEMNFVNYLNSFAADAAKTMSLEDLPEEQQATEKTLIQIESVVAEYARKNEAVFSQSDYLAASTALG